jgi:hypothetical protein
MKKTIIAIALFLSVLAAQAQTKNVPTPATDQPNKKA